MSLLLLRRPQNYGATKLSAERDAVVAAGLKVSPCPMLGTVRLAHLPCSGSSVKDFQRRGRRGSLLIAQNSETHSE